MSRFVYEVELRHAVGDSFGYTKLHNAFFFDKETDADYLISLIKRDLSEYKNLFIRKTKMNYWEMEKKNQNYRTSDPFVDKDDDTRRVISKYAAFINEYDRELEENKTIKIKKK